MLRITFQYKDQFSRGDWEMQICVVNSLKECIDFYELLDKPDVEYKIL